MSEPIIKLRRALAAAVTAAALFAPELAAQQATRRFDVRAWPDAAILGVATATSLGKELFTDRLARPRCAPCDPARLWGIDRATLGPERSGQARLSDITLVGTAIAGGFFLARSRSGEPADVLRSDLAVFTEAVAAASALSDLAKVLFHRPRPILYGPAAAAHATPGNALSLPSGHASIAFGAAAGFASVLHRRGIAGRHRTEIAALFGTAAATSALRVVAGRHFPTDVVAGAVLGTLVGWTLPQIHRTQE